ncbi:hypothetical protein ACFQRG_08305 [Scopulibacillus cellulosilyticus]|uniref:Uncharacterized protein n=1 Tax=Scopulibacillus cellulosilyticus TaxID=2665665 RepID=A0ABW2PU97_9BACL
MFDFIEKEKLLAQAEVVEWYIGKVQEAMESFCSTAHRKDSRLPSLAQDWESKSKHSYNSIMNESSISQFTAQNLGQELIDQLHQEARRLRQKAHDIEKREKAHESH